MKNPSLPGDKIVSLTIIDSSSYVIESTNFYPNFISPLFTPYDFTAILNPFPNNANIYSKYVFTFNPNFIIPANANIIIKFPITYGLLYSVSLSEIYCLTHGGLNYLKSCQNVYIDPLQTVQMITSKQSALGMPITLEYYGLVMYNTPSTNLDGFQIDIYYDTILIATTSSLSTVISNPMGIIYFLKCFSLFSEF